MLWIDQYRYRSAVLTYCDDFDRADGALGADWTVQASGPVISSNAASRNGASRYAVFNTVLASDDNWVEYDDELAAAHLNQGMVRVTLSGSLLSGYVAQYFPAYSSHPNGEWIISRYNGVSAVGYPGGGTQLANAFTPDPTGTVRMRVECETIAGNAVIRIFQYVAGTPTLRLTFTDSSGSKILVGKQTGITCGIDPPHTATPARLDNFCSGQL